MEGSVKQMLHMWGDASENARKEARRARIKRQYEQSGWSGWTTDQLDPETEDRINKELKERIFFASMETYSEEEGGDNTEVEEEEEEDNDWEDEVGEENNDEGEGVGEA
jgi:hypothetical protein